MTIFIYAQLKEDAWGGGNQFLKALREAFRRKGLYTESPDTADAILFNGYQDLGALVWSWVHNHKKKRIYRLGPVLHLHRGLKWLPIDMLVVLCANLFATLVVFQSHWSLIQAKKLGFSERKNHIVISNAVDEAFFFKKNSRNHDTKIKLVYASWSPNWNKGFAYLAFLDEHLDFSKYQMTFIGNAPISFKNIESIKPLASADLAKRLREQDIFVSPVKDDACSNAILEALSCGLPVVALNSGGNGELVQKGGLLFNNEEELLTAIDAVAHDLAAFEEEISLVSMGTIADQYLAAIRDSITL